MLYKAIILRTLPKNSWRWLLLILLFVPIHADWKLSETNGTTFIYNTATGEVFRYLNPSEQRGNEGEGFIQLRYRSYAAYPVGKSIVVPREITPDKLRRLEEKIVKRIIDGNKRTIKK